MNRIIYPNPPIVEALVEFRFIADVSREQLIEVLSEHLSNEYPGERHDQSEIQLQIKGNFDEQTASGSAQRTKIITFLRSSDGKRLLGCGDQLLSVNVLAPYPGWESFVAQIEDAIAALPRELLDQGFSKISVRYIDRIELPPVCDNISEYLSIIAHAPDGLPDVLIDHQQVYRTMDPETATEALFVVVLLTQTEPPILHLDLSLTRTKDSSTSVEAWRDVIEDLHDRQHRAFEASITDKTRELFQ